MKSSLQISILIIIIIASVNCFSDDSAEVLICESSKIWFRDVKQLQNDSFIILWGTDYGKNRQQVFSTNFQPQSPVHDYRESLNGTGYIYQLQNGNFFNHFNYDSTLEDDCYQFYYVQFFDEAGFPITKMFSLNKKVKCWGGFQTLDFAELTNGNIIFFWYNCGSNCVWSQEFTPNGQENGSEFLLSHNLYTVKDVILLETGNIILLRDNMDIWIFYPEQKKATLLTDSERRNLYEATYRFNDEQVFIVWERHLSNSEWSFFGQLFDSNFEAVTQEVDLGSGFKKAYLRDDNGFYVLSYPYLSEYILEEYNENAISTGKSFKINFSNNQNFTQLSDSKFVSLQKNYDSRLGCHAMDVRLIDLSDLENQKFLRLFSYESFKNDIKILVLNEEQLIVLWQNESLEIVAKSIRLSDFQDNISEFQLISPRMDATLFSRNVHFSWHSSKQVFHDETNEVHYTLFLSEDTLFNKPQQYPAGTDTMIAIRDLDPGKTYFWKVYAETAGHRRCSSGFNGFHIDHRAIEVRENEITAPQNPVLEQCYPNPFNAYTMISYYLPKFDSIDLSIFNMNGQKICSLFSGIQQPGIHHIIWDGKNDEKAKVATGIYFCKLKTTAFTDNKKMILLY